MVRNRISYFMGPKVRLSPGDGGDPSANLGASGETGAGGGIGSGAEANPSGTNGAGSEGIPSGDVKGKEGGQGAEETVESLKAKIAELENKATKNKAALDKAMREAGEANKALKARMTQEEIDAAAKKEEQEKRDQEFAELQKKVARADASKSIMGKIGLSEDDAGALADALYGAADIENALLIFQKAWQGKEKELKLQYGKIPAPGAGGDSNSPEAQAIARAQNIAKQQSAVNATAKKALDAYIR